MYSKFGTKTKREVACCFDAGGVRAVHLAYSAPVTLQGMNLDGAFLLDHIHVHWGDADARGSEHSLDGTFFPAEVRALHYCALDCTCALECTVLCCTCEYMYP